MDDKPRSPWGVLIDPGSDRHSNRMDNSSLTRSSFVHSFIPSFAHSFLFCLFIRSFVHSYFGVKGIFVREDLSPEARQQRKKDSASRRSTSGS